jgi:hypothetical protein
VFVDLTYDDPANHYHREQRLEFDGGNPQRASARIALFDPTKREYTLTYSIVGNGRLDPPPRPEDHRRARLRRREVLTPAPTTGE